MKTLGVPETVTIGTLWATLLFLAFVPTLCSTLSPQIGPPRPHALPAFPDPLPPRTGLVLEAGTLKSRCRQGRTLIPNTSAKGSFLGLLFLAPGGLLVVFGCRWISSPLIPNSHGLLYVRLPPFSSLTSP